MPKKYRLIIVLTAAVAIVSCSSYSSPTMPTNGGDTQVSVGSGGFSPSSITIPAGSSVTWTNTDTTSHTVTSDNGAFSSTLAAGAKYSHTFPAKGSFPYRDTLRVNTAGMVVVQ